MTVISLNLFPHVIAFRVGIKFSRSETVVNTPSRKFFARTTHQEISTRQSETFVPAPIDSEPKENYTTQQFGGLLDDSVRAVAPESLGKFYLSSNASVVAREPIRAVTEPPRGSFGTQGDIDRLPHHSLVRKSPYLQSCTDSEVSVHAKLFQKPSELEVDASTYCGGESQPTDAAISSMNENSTLTTTTNLQYTQHEVRSYGSVM